MISGTLTLFNWSLRADVRSIYPHIVRAGFAFFMLVSISFAYADALSSTGPGLKFFQSICVLNVLLISVSGISYFVSAVTEEKDTGTLSLLRLAGVSPLAIVLSKSTSRLIGALMLLAIQLPFTFLAITLGGVLWTQIVAAYLGLAAWLCLVANVALLCSVRCRTSGRAASLATTILIAFFVADPLLGAVTGLKGTVWISSVVVDGCRNLREFVQTISITGRLDSLLGSSQEVDLINEQFLWSMALGGALFAVSVLLFNRFSHPAEDNPHGRTALVRRFTIGRCWKQPVIWKDFLFFTGGRTFLVVKLLAYLLLILGFVLFHQIDRPNSPYLISGDLIWTAFLAVAVFVTVEVLLYSSGSLFQEVRQSTIATLTMLPTTTSVILLQKLVACMLALTPGIAALIVLYVAHPAAILQQISGTMVIWYLFMLTLSSHLTVLLSLYTRWAALPLAILLTAASNLCCPVMIMAVYNLSDQFARSNGLGLSIFLGSLINLVWAWLFVLLPMEIEIVNRWNRLSRE